jgi:hypothetical protein
MRIPTRKSTFSIWLLILFLLGKAYDVFLAPIVSINIENWAASKGVTDELIDGGQQIAPYLLSAAEWLNWALSGLSSPLFIGFVIGSLIFGFWDIVSKQLKRKDAVKDVEHREKIIPPTPKIETSTKRPADLALISFIDHVYPIVYDLSEIHVDRMGNNTSDWREMFLSGKSQQYFENAYREIQNVVTEFDGLRPLLRRHKIYDEIFAFDNLIATKLNAVPTALTHARQKAEILSHSFDEKSISIISDEIEEFRKAIGQLRLCLGNDFLRLLEKIRKDEIARTS